MAVAAMIAALRFGGFERFESLERFESFERVIVKRKKDEIMNEKWYFTKMSFVNVNIFMIVVTLTRA